MIKIAITTLNIGGDEELADALRTIVEQIEEGTVEGEIDLDGERCVWAVNKPGFTAKL